MIYLYTFKKHHLNAIFVRDVAVSLQVSFSQLEGILSLLNLVSSPFPRLTGAGGHAILMKIADGEIRSGIKDADGKKESRSAKVYLSNRK